MKKKKIPLVKVQNPTCMFFFFQYFQVRVLGQLTQAYLEEFWTPVVTLRYLCRRRQQMIRWVGLVNRRAFCTTADFLALNKIHWRSGVDQTSELRLRSVTFLRSPCTILTTHFPVRGNLSMTKAFKKLNENIVSRV